jgi:hypothetical protein
MNPAHPPAPPCDAVIEASLRRLGSRCAVAAAAALVAAGTVAWTVAGPGAAPDWMASPPGDSFLIALAALLLVLLSSGVYGKILRRTAGEDAPATGDGDVATSREEAMLSAYSWATGAAFAMLALAAGLGALVAVAGRAPLYGVVICFVSLLGMAARWPRRGGFELALDAEGSRPPPPEHGGTG